MAVIALEARRTTIASASVMTAEAHRRFPRYTFLANVSDGGDPLASVEPRNGDG